MAKVQRSVTVAAFEGDPSQAIVECHCIGDGVVWTYVVDWIDVSTVVRQWCLHARLIR